MVILRLTNLVRVEAILSGRLPTYQFCMFSLGSSLTSRTRIKTLAYDTILANARFFNNDINAVSAA